MKRNRTLVFFVGVMVFLLGTAIAQEHAISETSSNSKSAADAALSSANSKPTDDSPSAQKMHSTPQARRTPKSEQSGRAEGEQRFRENCGRCHQPPHKFPPRVMAAAIRHMRVRAMLTDEDMRLILKYMTQ